MATKKKNKLKGKKSRNKNAHQLLYKIIGLVLLVLALAILILPSYLPKSNLSTKNPIKINSALLSAGKTGNDPVRILIPNVNIDLKVIDAQIVNGYWELSDNTASYGLGSGLPGTKSNTVVFAHARVGLFYNLKDVKNGDIIYVFTKDKWYRYKVTKITAVYPNQTDVIMPTKTETLTLYTCTGFYDEKRLVVTAIPQS